MPKTFTFLEYVKIVFFYEILRDHFTAQFKDFKPILIAIFFIEIYYKQHSSKYSNTSVISID